MVKIGILGTGVMGRIHAEKISNLNHLYEFVGVYDLNNEIARETAEKYGVKVYSELDDLLNDANAVVIATSAISHYELIVKCLDKNLHILVEKPMVIDVDDSNRLIEIIGKSNVIFQVGFVERYNPVVKALKEYLGNRKINSIYFTREAIVSRITDTDVIFDMMIHDIDLMSFFLDDDLFIDKAEGRINAESGLIDQASVLFASHTGTCIMLFANRVSDNRARSIKVITEDECIEVDLINRIIKHIDLNLNTSYIQTCNEEDAITAEVSSFAENVQRNIKPYCDVYSGHKSVVIANQVQKFVITNLKLDICVNS